MRCSLFALALVVSPAFADTQSPAPQGMRPVVSEILSPGAAQSRVFTGRVEAEVTSTLAFLTLGRVATLQVATGDQVAKGAVLASLDQVTLDEDLTAAQAALQAAQARGVFAGQSFERVQALAKRAVASAAQLEQAQAALETAKAAIAAAEADLARAKDAASYSALTAPMDGIVTATLVDPGTVVSVGTPILTLAGLTGREAVLDVPPDFLSLLHLGDDFEVSGRGSAPIHGALTRIDPSEGAGARSRRIHLALGNPANTYRLGGLISARLSAQSLSVISVQKAALAGAVDAPQVWRVGEGRKVALVPVTLGEAVGDRVVVTAGLSAGDEIVVRGVHSLTEGQTVGAALTSAGDEGAN
ncbi:MAG: efflux RND transporter periplasmic adaptor subunit [Pseudomonadota bacterium]